MAGYQTPPDVEEAVKLFDEAAASHNIFVKHYERMERAYRGVLEPRSGADRWRHKLHPPYALNLIETIVANTIEENLVLSARPSPKVNLPFEEAQDLLAQAESVEYLLRHEHRVDDFDAKQRPLFLTASIGGRGVIKTYWNQTRGAVRRQGVVNKEIRNERDELVAIVPTIEEIVEEGILRDHSTAEIVDPRDFIVHEAARALQPFDPGGAPHVFHRGWYTFEQLKTLERGGYFKNVDALKESKSQEGEYIDRETQVFNAKRTKDLIEVVEYWCYKNGQVYRTIFGARKVLLRAQEASPFWHGEYPFIICTSMPQPFATRGIGDMELIAQLQEMLWEMSNQRLDNIELINNAITLIDEGVDDFESFEFFPGAKWEARPEQVSFLTPPYQLIDATLNAESLLKGDLQNVTNAAPFASGAQSATVDQKTATGASIVMSAAQKSLASKKYQTMQAIKLEGQQRLKNCQQFVDGSKLVHVLGKNGALSFRDIDILEMQGEYIIELAPMSESIMRQEKRAEALQLSQVLLNMAPLAAAGGAPLNIEEILKWTMEKWDLQDPERFFGAKGKGALAALGGGGGGGGGGAAPLAPPGGPNMGITSDTAVDAGSPSATGGMSLSPELMLQRAGALAGGVANA